MNLQSGYTQNFEPVNRQFVLGFWESLDTAGSKVEFQYNANELTLKCDGEFSYTFFGPDSVLSDSLSGVMINWPPYGCCVKKTDSGIQIEYTNFSNESVIIKYKRLSRKQ